jgi:phosphoribosyl transferase-like protein
MGEVSHPTERIVPISLYEVPSQLWRMLRYYKDVPGDTTPEAWRPTQETFQVRVAALLARFTRDHAACIAAAGGGAWDTVTIVPSGKRTGQHPVEQAVLRVPWLRTQYAALLQPTGGPLPSRVADDAKYRVTVNVNGKRILLVDDTFTSGASVQSAASALQRSGARVVATVVVGRVVNPEWPASKELWKVARKKKFSFDVCCVGTH